MITSWNVNGFFGISHYTEFQLKKGDSEEVKIQKKIAGNKHQKEILEKLKNQIEQYMENCDLLLLSEIPHKDYEELYNDFREFCNDKNWKFIDNLYSGSANIETVAICKEDADYERCYDDDVVKMEFGSYRNRVIALRKKSEPTEIIVGVHIPINKSIDYWNSLILTHRKIMKNNPEYRFIYIGDMNTYKDGTVNKMKLTEFMDEGLKDFWLESGHKHDAEAYPDATTYVHNGINERLDYVLVTGKDFDKLNKKYDMTVDHTVRVNGLSDHSAIILKEKTPETKKTGELK